MEGGSGFGGFSGKMAIYHLETCSSTPSLKLKVIFSESLEFFTCDVSVLNAISFFFFFLYLINSCF